MPIYRLQTSLQDHSGLARDQFVNSIYIDSISPGTDPQFEAWSVGLVVFYTAIQDFMANTIGLTGHVTKTYLVGAPLGSPPAHVHTFTLSPSTGAAYPNEVAACLSFHGALHPGWARQSTRGRIYLGPLATASGAAIPGGGSMPSSTFRNAATAAAAALATTIHTGDGGVNSRWCVYSKKHTASTPIVEVSMDDAWDTQRSRGTRPTFKTAVAVT